MNNPAEAIFAENDRRTIREVREDLKVREGNRAEAEEAFVKAEAKKRMAAYFAELEASFGEDAREEYQEEHPPWTFERVAEMRLRQTMHQDDFRAEAAARLAKLHEETANDE